MKGGATHTRKIELVLDESNANVSQLDIADEVLGSGCHLVESFLHFHPAILLKDNGDGTINLVGKSRRSMQFAVNNDLDYRIEKSIYCPEFGLQLENQCVVVSLRGTLPCQLSYRITIQ